MDIDIQPRPDAQYVVYNRVPKVNREIFGLKVFIKNSVCLYVNDNPVL